MAASYLVQVEGQDTSHSDAPGARYEPLLVPLVVEGEVPDLKYTLKAVKK